MFNKTKSKEIELDDMKNHILGYYMMYAWHNPKQYPKESFSLKNKHTKKQKVMSDSEIKSQMKSIAIMFGGKVQ